MAKTFSLSILGNHSQFNRTPWPLPNTHPYTHSFPFPGLRVPRSKDRIDRDIAWSSVIVSPCWYLLWHPIPTWFPIARPWSHGYNSMSKRKATLDSPLLLVPSQRGSDAFTLSHTTPGLWPACHTCISFHCSYTSRGTETLETGPQDSFRIHQPLSSLLLFLHLTSLGNFYLVLEKKKGTGKSWLWLSTYSYMSVVKAWFYTLGYWWL